jgi:threonine dehydratase
MRLVLAPHGDAPATATFPDPERLAAARDLAARFPQARLRPTAVVRCAELDLTADPAGKTRIWIALESLQVTGSFKVRGALLALSRLVGKGGRAITASAGNHGAGVSYAAKMLGVPALVVVPSAAPRAKRDKIAAWGAEIVVCASAHFDDAEAMAKEIAAKESDTGGVFVSAYDDLDVVAGNGASLAYDIVRGLGRAPDVLLAPIGGGGLCTGLAVALAERAGESLDARRRVWGVQSEASPGAARSLEAGHAIVRLVEDAPTLAEGLEGGIAVDAFARARASIAGVGVVSEADIARAMAYAHRDLGLVVEGSAAVVLVPLLAGLPDAMRGGDLVAVLTGRNVDPERLARVLAASHS